MTPDDGLQGIVFEKGLGHIQDRRGRLLPDDSESMPFLMFGSDQRS